MSLKDKYNSLGQVARRVAFATVIAAPFVCSDGCVKSSLDSIESSTEGYELASSQLYDAENLQSAKSSGLEKEFV